LETSKGRSWQQVICAWFNGIKSRQDLERNVLRTLKCNGFFRGHSSQLPEYYDFRKNNPAALKYVQFVSFLKIPTIGGEVIYY
jgi:hypothetical protein